jgi:amidohydrolase
VDITALPAVVSVGAINGGVRHNIIAETVEMLGTIRTFSPAMRQDIIDRIGRTVTNVAEANGASARLEMMPAPNPVLENDPALTARAVESLRAVLGADKVETIGLMTVAEDFAHVAQLVPSFYYWVGVTAGRTRRPRRTIIPTCSTLMKPHFRSACARCCALPSTTCRHRRHADRRYSLQHGDLL